MGLKILQLISSTGFFGAENVILELSTELTRLGHSITVGVFQNLRSPNLELAEKAKGNALKTRVFECGGKVDFKTLSSLSSYVRENSINVVHSHGYKSNIYAVFSNMRNKKPLVATCHNWIISSGKMSFYTSLDKFFLKKFDAVVPVSSGVHDALLESGVDGKRLFLIENGINVKKFQNGSDLKGVRDRLIPGFTGPVVGTVGRLAGEKGHTYFLQAAKKVLESKDCFFVIVGDGALRSRLEDEAVTLGIKNRVIFTGKRSDIPELLSIMDIFALPSLTEGQPMALLEAMASGKAIVATAVGDIPRILKNGDLGVLTPPKDPEALAEGVLYYLNNPGAARESARASYNEAIERYSSARMAQEYMRVYNSLVS